MGARFISDALGILDLGRLSRVAGIRVGPDELPI